MSWTKKNAGTKLKIEGYEVKCKWRDIGFTSYKSNNWHQTEAYIAKTLKDNVDNVNLERVSFDWPDGNRFQAVRENGKWYIYKFNQFEIDTMIWAAEKSAELAKGNPFTKPRPELHQYCFKTAIQMFNMK